MKKVSSFAIGLMLLSMIAISISDAHAQQPTQQILQNLEKAGTTGCEVWQINEFFHLPVRVNILHERVTGEGGAFEWDANDPASDLFWEGAPTTFQMVTSDPDRYTAKLVLDYQEKHERPRQVFYQVYAQDNTLMMEGNWQHEGFTFCKYIVFSTSEAPHILTNEEIQRENNEFNLEFRKDVAEGQTTVENALIWITVVIMLATIMMGIVLFLNYISQRKLGTVANKPVKKLDQVIEIFRKVVKNQSKMTMEQNRVNNTIQRESREMNQKFLTTLENRMEDIAIVALRARKVVDDNDAFPTPKGLVLSSGDDKVDKPVEHWTDLVKDETEVLNNTSNINLSTATEPKKQSLLDTIVYGKTEGEFIKEQVDNKSDVINPSPTMIEENPYGGFITGNEDEEVHEYHPDKNWDVSVPKELEGKQLVTETPEPKSVLFADETQDVIPNPEPEPIQDESTLSPEPETITMKEVPPCETCGEIMEEMIGCKLCSGVYCELHESTHKCIKEIPSEKSETAFIDNVKTGGAYLKEQFVDPKPPKVTDNLSIDIAINTGRTVDSIQAELKELFLKNGSIENEKLYEDYHKEYAKTPTIATDIKLKALLEVLQKQLY